MCSAHTRQVGKYTSGAHRLQQPNEFAHTRVRDMIRKRHGHMNKIPAVFALLCVTALPIAAQTKVLVAKGRVPVSVAGEYHGGIAFPTACDEQGRFYVKLVQIGPGMVGPLFRLSSKGVAEAEFDTSGALINRYAVRPDGGVIMMRVNEATKIVDNFAPDGARESSVTLERPPTPFFPSQLAVFHSGEILISGLQYQPGYKAGTAIYDPTGHLIKQVVLDGDVELERAIANDTRAQKQNTSAIDRSVAVTGDDGLVYLMRATSPASVYAISASGDVVRKIVVNPPTGAGSPYFGIRVFKNRLVVQFRRSCDRTDASDSCRSSTYAVVDATTGQKLAAYEADKEAGGTMLCYAPDPDRFLIFSDRHGLEFVTAEPK
jgi:hypothetical protein